MKDKDVCLLAEKAAETTREQLTKKKAAPAAGAAAGVAAAGAAAAPAVAEEKKHDNASNQRGVNFVSQPLRGWFWIEDRVLPAADGAVAASTQEKKGSAADTATSANVDFATPFDATRSPLGELFLEVELLPLRVVQDRLCFNLLADFDTDNVRSVLLDVSVCSCVFVTVPCMSAPPSVRIANRALPFSGHECRPAAVAVACALFSSFLSLFPFSLCRRHNVSMVRLFTRPCDLSCC
jgi:hypothetical protein